MRYISWSQFWLYSKSPRMYFEQYVLGLRPEPTKKMVFGSIFSKAYENRRNGRYDPYKELKERGFTADYERVLRSALSQLPPLEGEECEKTFEIENKPLNLLGKFDGVIESKNLIIENKTGATWTQERADTAPQLTFYALVYYLATGRNPRMVLNSVRQSDGKVFSFKTKRTVEQMKELKKVIDDVADRIKRGVWS